MQHTRFKINTRTKSERYYCLHGNQLERVNRSSGELFIRLRRAAYRRVQFYYSGALGGGGIKYDMVITMLSVRTVFFTLLLRIVIVIASDSDISLWNTFRLIIRPNSDNGSSRLFTNNNGRQNSKSLFSERRISSELPSINYPQHKKNILKDLDDYSKTYTPSEKTVQSSIVLQDSNKSPTSDIKLYNHLLNNHVNRTLNSDVLQNPNVNSVGQNTRKQISPNQQYFLKNVTTKVITLNSTSVKPGSTHLKPSLRREDEDSDEDEDDEEEDDEDEEDDDDDEESGFESGLEDSEEDEDNAVDSTDEGEKDDDSDEADENDGEPPRKRKHDKKKKKKKGYKSKHLKKLKKYMFPLLLAYKLKFFTLIPLMLGGLVLIVGSTGFAGFFFALFAIGLSLQKH
ncbi:uncharacterized protein LOC142317809 [Lycorma delicatula]|uniref:uncharacterized protein LOC142317809 n=1 Tax=Lycorma delicatula TaxID=130591 RepID=UPI003F511FE0